MTSESSERDGQQGGHEHADQQGEIPLHRHAHIQLPGGRFLSGGIGWRRAG
jgi:hypothetical protein